VSSLTFGDALRILRVPRVLSKLDFCQGCLRRERWYYIGHRVYEEFKTGNERYETVLDICFLCYNSYDDVV
jgi:hypothetical protein